MLNLKTKTSIKTAVIVWSIGLVAISLVIIVISPPSISSASLTADKTSLTCDGSGGCGSVNLTATISAGSGDIGSSLAIFQKIDTKGLSIATGAIESLGTKSVQYSFPILSPGSYVFKSCLLDSGTGAIRCSAEIIVTAKASPPIGSISFSKNPAEPGDTVKIIVTVENNEKVAAIVGLTLSSENGQTSATFTDFHLQPCPVVAIKCIVTWDFSIPELYNMVDKTSSFVFEARVIDKNKLMTEIDNTLFIKQKKPNLAVTFKLKRRIVGPGDNIDATISVIGANKSINVLYFSTDKAIGKSAEVPCLMVTQDQCNYIWQIKAPNKTDPYGISGVVINTDTDKPAIWSTTSFYVLNIEDKTLWSIIDILQDYYSDQADDRVGVIVDLAGYIQSHHIDTLQLKSALDAGAKSDPLLLAQTYAILYDAVNSKLISEPYRSGFKDLILPDIRNGWLMTQVKKDDAKFLGAYFSDSDHYETTILYINNLNNRQTVIHEMTHAYQDAIKENGKLNRDIEYEADSVDSDYGLRTKGIYEENTDGSYTFRRTIKFDSSILSFGFGSLDSRREIAEYIQIFEKAKINFDKKKSSLNSKILIDGKKLTSIKLLEYIYGVIPQLKKKQMDLYESDVLPSAMQDWYRNPSTPLIPFTNAFVVSYFNGIQPK